MGTLIWALVACGDEEPEPMPSSADVPVDGLQFLGQVRSDGEVVQAILELQGPEGRVQLGGADELSLSLPDGDSLFEELFDHRLVAQLPSPELEGTIELWRESDGKVQEIRLPPPLELALEEPQSYGTPHRVTWQPSERGSVSLILEGLCLEQPISRSFSTDQGWYEVQPADLPLGQESCELWLTLTREEPLDGLAMKQIRTISFVMGPVAGSTP